VPDQAHDRISGGRYQVDHRICQRVHLGEADDEQPAPRRQERWDLCQDVAESEVVQYRHHRDQVSLTLTGRRANSSKRHRMHAAHDEWSLADRWPGVHPQRQPLLESLLSRLPVGVFILLLIFYSLFLGDGVPD
jgi:hypothetical protein